MARLSRRGRAAVVAFIGALPLVVAEAFLLGASPSVVYTTVVFLQALTRIQWEGVAAIAFVLALIPAMVSLFLMTLVERHVLRTRRPHVGATLLCLVLSGILGVQGAAYAFDAYALKDGRLVPLTEALAEGRGSGVALLPLHLANCRVRAGRVVACVSAQLEPRALTESSAHRLVGVAFLSATEMVEKEVGEAIAHGLEGALQRCVEERVPDVRTCVAALLHASGRLPPIVKSVVLTSIDMKK